MRNKAFRLRSVSTVPHRKQSPRVLDKLQIMELETIKKYINVMRNYPEIYAVGDSDYTNIYKKEIAWRKIKQKMGMDVKKLKVKWRNLRDTYMKYKKCRLSDTKGPNTLYNWVWAKEMSFVEPYIKLRPKKIAAHIDINSDSDVTVTEDENEQNRTKNVQNPELETEKNKIRPIKREQENNTVDNIITNTNTESTQDTAVAVPCDRTDMEFLGYASTVKRLSLRNQALVKLQITKILTRYQLEELNSNPLCNEDRTYNPTVQLTNRTPGFIDVGKSTSY